MKPIKVLPILGLVLFCFQCLPFEGIAQAKSTKVSQGTYKTIYEMLRDVPGLEVKLSNDKSGGSVVIRGVASLMNQKPPLFVVDGSIYAGSITNINPQDVESINVLKDAASTTTYGSQGAAGVILINTIKGGGSVKQAVVESHEGSAYTYFIEHKTPLKVFGNDDKVLIEGVINSQRDGSLVFIKKKKEILIAIKDIKRVEMIPE